MATTQAELDRQIERYREAATMALEQLEWAIGYLNRSGVAGAPLIAAVLDRNRKRIAMRIR